MLSLFRRPGADLQIEVDKTVVQVGDEVRARVTLVPKQDFDVRQGNVELICTETYVQMTSSQYGQHYHRRTRSLSLEGGSFMEGGTVRAGLSYSGDVTLAVPAAALPTLTGVSVNKIDPGISWTVIASLDVAKSRDIQHSQEVTVIPPAAPEERQSRPVTAESRHRQCVLTLGLSSGDARSGDRLAGSLRAEMLQDVGVSEVRVEMVRIEKFGNVVRDHTADRVVLEPEGSLSAGEIKEWRFLMNVGNVVAPTLKTEKSSVRWLVKGVLSRKMRPDLRVEREIGVDF